jgi:cell wall-associated NlpC family hydrolase
MDSKDILKDYALSFIGVPYNYGGDNRLTGLDCSQLVIELLISQGLMKNKSDTTAQGIYSQFAQYKTKVPQFGALVFFGIMNTSISHVGFCLNDKLMLEAGAGDSKTQSLDSAKARGAMVRIRPISMRSDAVGFVMPPYGW